MAVGDFSSNWKRVWVGGTEELLFFQLLKNKGYSKGNLECIWKCQNEKLRVTVA